MNLQNNIEHISTSLPPIEIFEKFKDCRHSFFLDSAYNPPQTDELGRYSFIGLEPFLTFKSKDRKITIVLDGKEEIHNSDPFTLLKKLLDEYKSTKQSDLPFTGGIVGYFGYDLCNFIEKLPSNAVDDIGLPDCYLGFYDRVIIYDNKNKKCYLSTYKIGNDYKDKIKKIKNILRDTALRSQNKCIPVNLNNKLTCNFTKEKYITAIKKTKDYISAGDIFQANISQRFCLECSCVSQEHCDTIEIYKKLRKVSPAPFAGYLNFNGITVLSSSPERFLKLNGNIVETRPMKGTRPRGLAGLAENHKLMTELINSKKDKAELIMIVDLLRNDLGKVCEYGSVQIKHLRTLETYPTVFQTTSTVTGRLSNGKGYVDLLKACFPGGSITGAPKVRSMEIIDELEPTKRGIYTGAFGYIGFNGSMDLSMVIRTIVVKNNKAYFQVGGGIVSDSDPEDEYNETLYKARGIMMTLSNPPKPSPFAEVGSVGIKGGLGGF